MAARQVTFGGFDPYTLRGVQVTEREFGRGSYASVVELEYRGLKCAGKKLYQVLQQQGIGHAVHRFEEECHLLSQTRHPNVVQFLGVFFQQNARIPTLVMEYLPTNLTSCIEQYGILPKEINYSILHDVSLGLNYLHTQTPPIIHRDLSSNNILLTPNMTAKISDLGVARILNLTPMQMSRMTETPGTPAYMPPEVMVADPRYDTSVDVFSYGVMIIHIISGEWPVPKCEPIRIEPNGHMTPVSEVERREEYLHNIREDHPLMNLIRRCVSNAPQQRCGTAEIVDQMKNIVMRFPLSFANRVEMMSRIETLEEEKRVLVAEGEEKEGEIEQGLEQVREKEEENTRLQEHHQIFIDHLKLAHSTEVDRLKLAHSTEVDRLTQTYSTEVDRLILAHSTEVDRLTLAHSTEVDRLTLAYSTEVEQLRSELSNVNTQVEIMSDSISRKESEITSKETALAQKDATISKLNEQLTRTRKYLSSKPQPLLANISWRECSQLPFPSDGGQTAVINNKLYYGGFGTDENENKSTICCYDPSRDDWNKLPQLPVKYFGLGQVNRELVAVGGRRISDGEETNQVYMFDQRRQKWKQPLPPMRTARNSPAVISCNRALIVAGGNISMLGDKIKTVELYRPETSQWYTTDPLPIPCRSMSPVVIQDTCYLIGGYSYPSQLDQVICASIDQLIDNAMPLNLASTDGRVHAQDSVSAWKQLANAPTYQPTAAVIAGTVLAIGGSDSNIDDSEDEVIQSTVHIYSPSTDSWIYITDLPAPLLSAATAVMSSTEIMVIGGWNGGLVNTIYKGTLSVTIDC